MMPREAKSHDMHHLGRYVKALSTKERLNDEQIDRINDAVRELLHQHAVAVDQKDVESDATRQVIAAELRDFGSPQPPHAWLMVHSGLNRQLLRDILAELQKMLYRVDPHVRLYLVQYTRPFVPRSGFRFQASGSFQLRFTALRFHDCLSVRAYCRQQSVHP